MMQRRPEGHVDVSFFMPAHKEWANPDAMVTRIKKVTEGVTPAAEAPAFASIIPMQPVRHSGVGELSGRSISVG
jgi:hypothetical protein